MNNQKMVRKHTFRRVIKTVFKAYPVMVPFIIMCIISQQWLRRCQMLFCQPLLKH